MTKINQIAINAIAAICLFLSLELGLPSLVFGQTAALLPMAQQQFFDQNGNPLALGTVTTYVVGTSTLKTTWRDAAETIPNTNPIILDAGGRAIIFGDGNYRQLVKDRNGNTIWDAVTSAFGVGGATLFGDGTSVGTILPWSGLTAPTHYAFAYGQELSRVTYSSLYTVVTLSAAFNCTSASAILSGLADTTQIPVGAVVEATCVVGGTTVLSKTASTVTLSNNASVTVGLTGRFFPYGNGNGTTTFNVPDLRGRTLAGRDNMGGTAASRLTSTYFANPGTGATGGTQSKTLVTGNLPAYTPAGSIVSTQPAHQHFVANGDGGTTGLSGSNTAQAGANHGTDFSYTLAGSATAASAGLTSTATPAITSTLTGTAQGGTSTPFATVQPTMTLNYIIKITPDANISTPNVVTSIQAMVGDLACATPIVCTDQIISLSSNSTDNEIYYACTGTGDQVGINTALATGFNVHVGGSNCVVAADINLTIGGQQLRCDRWSPTNISVTTPGGFTNGVMYFNTLGETGPTVRDCSIGFTQPDTSDPLSLTTYVPAIKVRVGGAPRFQVINFRTERGTYGIDMTGNSGGAIIDGYSCSAFITCIQGDGSLDTVRINNAHIWPFGLTDDQRSIFRTQAIGMSFGHMDGLTISNSMCISWLCMNFFVGADTNSSFGTISNHDFDSHNGILMSSGAMTCVSCVFTIQENTSSAIVMSGGSLNVSSAYFLQSTSGTNPTNSISGGYFTLSSSHAFSAAQDTTMFSATSTAIINIHDVIFERTANIAYTRPVISVGSGALATLIGNRIGPKGTGAGTFITVAADGAHNISNNTGRGWTCTFPSAVIGIYLLNCNGDAASFGPVVSEVAKLNSAANDPGTFAAGFANNAGTVGSVGIAIGVGPATADTTSKMIGFYDSNLNVIQGSITRNGAGAVAYNTSSDIRGKPNRELLGSKVARNVIDSLRIWDFDKDGNTIRGVGVIAQEAALVLPSMVTKGSTEKEWWSAEKAAPVSYLVRNVQSLNKMVDDLTIRLEMLETKQK